MILPPSGHGSHQERLRLEVPPPAAASLLGLSPGMRFLAQIHPAPNPPESPRQNLSLVPKAPRRCPLASPGDAPPAHLLLPYCFGAAGLPPCPSPACPGLGTGDTGAGDAGVTRFVLSSVHAARGLGGVLTPGRGGGERPVTGRTGREIK